MSRDLIARLFAAATVASLMLGALAMPVASGGGDTLIVDDNATQCPSAGFDSIQAAIDAAGPGDKVLVCAGTYLEALTIDKAVTVKSRPLYAARIVPPEGVTPTGDVLAPVVISGEGARMVGFKVDLPAGPAISGVRPSLVGCQHFDAAILVTGSSAKLRSNRIDAFGENTLSGICGYDYGVIVGNAANAAVRPTGLDTENAKVTFNWVTDFKLGGILVRGPDTSALVRRNTVRYLHLDETESPCVVATGCVRNTGGFGPPAVGITVEDAAEANVIRNAIKSGPNAAAIFTGIPTAPTPRLDTGILVANTQGATNRYHHNAIWRVYYGIRTAQGDNVAEFSENHITDSYTGVLAIGDDAEWFDNHVHNNYIGIRVDGEGNNLHDNNSHDNGLYDCLDTTAPGGSGTAGTDNTWTNNIGPSENPTGICADGT